MSGQEFAAGGEHGPELESPEVIDPQIKIKVLEEVLAAARENARIVRSEDRDRETCRHWSAVCGWIRHRIRKLEAGEETDWPDAAMFRAGEEASDGDG